MKSDPRPCRLCKRPLALSEYPTYITDKGETRARSVCRDCRGIQKDAWRAKNAKKDRRYHAKNKRRYRVLNTAKVREYEAEYQRKRRAEIRATKIKEFTDRGMYTIPELLKRHAIGRSWLEELLRKGVIRGEKWRKHWYVLESSLKAYYYR